MSANPGIKNWKTQRVWIVGASSGIGAALADLLLQQGAKLALSARNEEALQKVSAGRALCLALDVNDAQQDAKVAEQVHSELGGLDTIVWLAGSYSPMSATSFDLQSAKDSLRTNYEGILDGLAAVLPKMLDKSSGNIVLVASVAGYSGLPQALAYGPTKAAIINLAESLYLHCRGRGIGVYLVNPGFVKTPMTAPNEFPMPALISPELAASHIMLGMQAGKFEIHFPARFTLLLKFLRILPYRLYFALVARATRSTL